MVKDKKYWFIKGMLIVIIIISAGYIGYSYSEECDCTQENAVEVITNCNFVTDYMNVIDNLEECQYEVKESYRKNYILMNRLEIFCHLFNGDYIYEEDVCILPNDMEI